MLRQCETSGYGQKGVGDAVARKKKTGKTKQDVVKDSHVGCEE